MAMQPGAELQPRIHIVYKPAISSVQPAISSVHMCNSIWDQSDLHQQDCPAVQVHQKDSACTLTYKNTSPRT